MNLPDPTRSPTV